MRIDVGPGFRVYFVWRGAGRVVLLTGGDKASQRRDTEEARRLAGNL